MRTLAGAVAAQELEAVFGARLEDVKRRLQQGHGLARRRKRPDIESAPIAVIVRGSVGAGPGVNDDELVPMLMKMRLTW